MQNKVTVMVRDCTVEVYPDDGGAHVHEIGRAPTNGSQRYESAFHVNANGDAIGQGFVGKVSEDEKAALDEALREAVVQARTRWPEVDAVFAAQDRVRARGMTMRDESARRIDAANDLHDADARLRALANDPDSDAAEFRAAQDARAAAQEAYDLARRDEDEAITTERLAREDAGRTPWPRNGRDGRRYWRRQLLHRLAVGATKPDRRCAHDLGAGSYWTSTA